MQHSLSTQGFLVGTGSACSARRSDDRIHNALGIPKAYASGIIRISFGRENNKAQIERLAQAIAENYHNMKKYIR